ncbi:MAG: CRISPR-associated CARF protein Csa3 [Candidatus Methanomethylicia archaeon]
MTRALFITLGFEEKFAVRALTRHGLDKHDKIILITGTRIEKVDRAIGFISEFISKYYGDEVKLRVEEVPVHDICIAASLIRKLIVEEAKNVDQVIVNLSGGMRVIIAAVIIALRLINIQNITIELETEDSSTLVQIPIEAIKIQEHQIGPEKSEILKILTDRDDYLTVGEIAKAVGKDESTVRRHLARLRNAKLIEVKKLKPLTVKATQIAKIFI